MIENYLVIASCLAINFCRIIRFWHYRTQIRQYRLLAAEFHSNLLSTSFTSQARTLTDNDDTTPPTTAAEFFDNTFRL
ncbi:hypothetical protein Hanom_Chr09g00857381 [Helianthus anomalus]